MNVDKPIFFKLGFKVLDIGDSARIFSVVFVDFQNLSLDFNYRGGHFNFTRQRWDILRTLAAGPCQKISD